MQPRIARVELEQPDILAVTFANGETVEIDLTPVISRGNLGAALADSKYQSRVKVTEMGRSLLWPNGLELCADALWLEGKKADRSQVG